VARVDHELRFESDDSRTAELRLVLPTAGGAGLQSLEACRRGRCRRGLPDTTSLSEIDAYEVATNARGRGPQAVARAVPGSDDGPVFDIHAAPVSRGDPLTLHLSYVSPVDTVAGHLLIDLQRTGGDPRIAEPEVEVVGPDGSPGRFEDGEASWEIPAGTTLASAWSARCGPSRCARLWVAAARDASPRDALILVDRSPSMLELPRQRVPRTLAALLAELPDESRARIVGFAARAEELAPATPVRELDPGSLSLDPEIRLGAATRTESTIPQVEELSGREPLVIMITDEPRVATPAMRGALRRVGGFMSVVALDGGSARVPTALEDLVSIGTLADGPERELRRHLTRAVAPVVFPRVSIAGLGPGRREGALRAGGALTFEGQLTASNLRPVGVVGLRRTSAPSSVAAGFGVLLARRAGIDDVRRSRVTVAALDLDNNEKWTTPWLGEYPPLRVAVGPLELRETPPVLLGPDYGSNRIMPPTYMPRVIRCRFCYGCRIMGSLSKESAGRIMRSIEPRVRACFARERAGRPQWSARAQYTVLLERREVVAVTVGGTGMSERLEGCLVDAVDQLVIPSFPGRVIIRYPFVATEVTPPPPIAVEPSLDRTLDRLFSTDAGAPR
jgi:hypothetical protein